ncbi:MAG: response regulator [Sandaracinaceae bacterium]
MEDTRQTALGVARARFVEGLERKAREVRASLALLSGSPDEPRALEELRRRLHALYASAQVFRLNPLASALKDALHRIDRIREGADRLEASDLEALTHLAAELPRLGDEPPEERRRRRRSSVVDLPIPDPTPIAPSSPPARTRSSRRVPTPRPAEPSRTGFDALISALVLAPTAEQAAVREALTPDRFEVRATVDPAEAMRLARTVAPDVIVADRALVAGNGHGFLSQLRADPLTDFLPVVLLLPEGAGLDPRAAQDAGADASVERPFQGPDLARTVARHSRALSAPVGPPTLSGDLTVAQVADRLADEFRHGLVDATSSGGEVPVPLGDGSELMAVAWSTIGKVRAHLAERSGGRVRFEERTPAGLPEVMSVVADPNLRAEVSDHGEDEPLGLDGRRVLVVDDDPAVVWFFAGLLREQGAMVVEASDGLQALQEARRQRPDLVISDILMPRLDGFGLTRSLKRDPALWDVPVILLSWKEDFLERMRQLRAGAADYLRKEAEAGQVLERIRRVLAPRARLEGKLKAEPEVRGRVEDVGIHTLLRTAARLRPDVRLSVRDAGYLYEVDLREGGLAEVSRTASDGAFSRGPSVLPSLLGVASGRFVLVDDRAPVRRSITDGLDEALRDGHEELAARVDAVSGAGLSRAASVHFDDQLLEGALRTFPEPVTRLVEELRTGKGPRELLLEGLVDPPMLEEVLVDLARQGVVREVRGPKGEDRIAEAREARRRGWTSSTEASQESAQIDDLEILEAMRRAPGFRPPRVTSSLDEPFAEPRRQPNGRASTPPAPATEPGAPRRDPMPRSARGGEDREVRAALAELVEMERERISREVQGPDGDAREAPRDDDDGPELIVTTGEGRALGPASDGPGPLLIVASSDDDLDGTSEPPEPSAFAPSGGGPVALAASRPASGEPLGRESTGIQTLTRPEDEQITSVRPVVDLPEEARLFVELEREPTTRVRMDGDGASATGGAVDAEEDSAAAFVLTVPSKTAASQRPSLDDIARSSEPAEEPPEAPVDLKIPPSPRRVPTPTPVDLVAPEPAPTPGSARPWLGVVLVLLVFGAIGFLGWRYLSSAITEPETVGPVPPEGADTVTVEHASRPSARETAEAEAPPEPVDLDFSLPAPYGRETAGIAELGVGVEDGQGLLVLEAPEDGVGVEVEVGERQLQLAAQPVALALEAGVHHVTFRREDREQMLYVPVREGRTRYAPVPVWEVLEGPAPE